VIIGAALAARLGSGTHPLTGAEIATFAIAAVGSLALWWVYFDRAAGEAAAVIAASPDPGRLGRSAYHLIHPIMVAGIIVAAAADGAMANLASRDRAGASAPGWVAGLILGGPALFLIGHAAFKAVIWRRASWPRVGAAAVLGLLGLLAPHVPALALAGCGAAAVVAVAVADQVWRPVSEPSPSAAAGPAG